MTPKTEHSDDDGATYPKHWYTIAGLAWVALGLGAGLFSVWLYVLQGETVAGILAVVVGLLYMLNAKITTLLRNARYRQLRPVTTEGKT